MRGEKNCRKQNRISRSRSLGVTLLILALFIFQVTIFVLDKFFSNGAESNTSKGVEKITESDGEMAGTILADENLQAESLFQFDPNTITLDSLSLLGFSSRQAQTIINYRSRGGRFRRPEDFARMYVVDSAMFEKVREYIHIPQTTQPSLSVPAKPVKAPPVVDTLRRRVYVKMSRTVDVNRADSAALVSLYGIGGYYARKIIEYRTRLGGFYAPEQLMEVDGIDSLRYAGFASYLTADPATVRKFSLDTAGKRFLIEHPYIGAYAARGILLYREKFGAEACNLHNLVKERILSQKNAARLWPYLE